MHVVHEIMARDKGGGVTIIPANMAISVLNTSMKLGINRLQRSDLLCNLLNPIQLIGIVIGKNC